MSQIQSARIGRRRIVGRILFPTGILLVALFIAADGARWGHYPVFEIFGVFIVIAAIVLLSSRDVRREDQGTDSQPGHHVDQ